MKIYCNVPVRRSFSRSALSMDTDVFRHAPHPIRRPCSPSHEELHVKASSCELLGRRTHGIQDRFDLRNLRNLPINPGFAPSRDEGDLNMNERSREKQIHRVAVTLKAGESNRLLIRGLFDASADLAFIADMQAEERKQVLADTDVLLTWSLPKELHEGEAALLKNTRLIQLMSAGADHVQYAELPSHITIASNVGAFAGPMAEHVMAMTLALSKNLIREHRNLAGGVFNQSGPNRMLRGMVCGILGFGGIGKAAAALMRSFGMRINAANTTGRTDEPVEFIGTLSDLQHILSSSDVVVVSLPLTKGTRGLIGKRELAWMKNDAILINVARGAIIDEAALYERLKENPDFKAGIDAWWIEPFTHGMFTTNYPFFTLPNVVGSPHNSAIVHGMNEEVTRRAVENIQRFWNREPVRGVVRREDYR